MTRHPAVILHIDLQRDWGGGQRQVLTLLSRLDSRRFFPLLMCRRKSALETAARRAGVKTVPYPGFAGLFFGARKLGFVSLIHTHSSSALNAGILLRFLLNKPLLHTRRFVSDRKLSVLSVRKLASADAVAAISMTVLRQMTDSGFPAEKIIVIPSSVEKPVHPSSAKRSRNRPRIVVGSIGKLSDLKNHICLVRAAGILGGKRRDFEVRIVGDGARRKMLQTEADRAKFPGLVTFTGFVKDASDLITGFDIFVMPSLREGLGTSVLDAMLRKVTVIASNIPAIREMVVHGRTGLLFDPRDPAALAAGLRRLMDDPSLRRNLAEAAYKSVKTKFLPENMAKSYSALYRKLLQA